VPVPVKRPAINRALLSLDEDGPRGWHAYRDRQKFMYGAWVAGDFMVAKCADGRFRLVGEDGVVGEGFDSLEAACNACTGLPPARVLELCVEYFHAGIWMHTPQHGNIHAYFGEEVIGPLNLHVGLDTGDGHWEAETGEGIATARVGEFMATADELAERGIEPGSEAELREVLEALRFNIGQVLVEMQRGYTRATAPYVHHYVEPGSRS